MDNYNPYAFIASDIVIWNGIVSTYGSIEHLIQEGDQLRIAADEDELKYQEVNA
jgi:hypothetical protein